MKSIDSIQKTVHELTAAAEHAKSSGDMKVRKTLNRILARRAHLKQCIQYLKTKPTQEFLLKEQARVSNRINLLLKDFKPYDYLPKAEIAKLKKEHEKNLGISALRKHLTTINYLLKD